MEPGALLLLREGPAHGYELAEELSGILAIERVDVGNLYRLLRRLEDDGLVTSVWDDANGGRAKRVYELTEEGAEVLDDWAPRLAETRDALNRFLERHASGRSSENETPGRQHHETGETEQHDPT
jgi:poly-beta-hydroxybutyrate-responsive repressor